MKSVLMMAAGVTLTLGVMSEAWGVTNRWTNGAGDFLWTNSANWSPAGPPATTADVLIDEASPAGTILLTGAVGGTAVKSITFAKAGGFAIEQKNMNMQASAISVLVSNQTALYSCFVPYVKACTITVAGGSTLHTALYGYIAGARITVQGGGSYWHADKNSLTLACLIKDNSTVDFQGYTTVTNLQGLGTIGMQRTNSDLVFASAALNFNSFTGLVLVGNAAGSSTAAAAFNATNGPVSGLDCLVFTNAMLSQKGGEKIQVLFSNCTFRGNGRIISTYNGKEDSANVWTNSYAGCTFRPGTNAASAGAFVFSGNAMFAKAGSSNSVFHIKFTGTNGVAGVDHDNLTARSILNAGGTVNSVSGGGNRLADCALVVDLSGLPPATALAGRTNVVLTTTSDLSSGCSFASVQWIAGTGTVNYLDKKVTLTDVLTAKVSAKGTLISIL